VLQTTNIPKEKFISVRAGGTRRQAQLSTLASPFKFPVSIDKCATLKVEVLDMLAFSRFPFNPAEEEFNIALDSAADTEPEEPMEVRLKVRSVADADVNKSKADEDSRRETSAKDYLEEHNLVNFLQTLLHGLMKDKPHDPYRYLQREISRKAAEAGHSPRGSTTAAPSTMMPPSPDLQELSAKSDQLRADNAYLREALDAEAATRARLQDEVSRLRGEPTAVADAQDLQNMDPSEMSPEQLQSYREMLILQEEIAALAKENAMFVAKMARVRVATDSVRTEITSLQQQAVK